MGNVQSCASGVTSPSQEGLMLTQDCQPAPLGGCSPQKWSESPLKGDTPLLINQGFNNPGLILAGGGCPQFCKQTTIGFPKHKGHTWRAPPALASPRPGQHIGTCGVTVTRGVTSKRIEEDLLNGRTCNELAIVRMVFTGNC